ncbi:MAG: dihydroxy-acid dehydratase [Clostridiales bacterium]|nr:dihydroxy-acid dehydratase [Clostridiales bacterium]
MKDFSNRPYWNDPSAAHRRVMYKAVGFRDKDIRQKPHIGVANAFSEASPGTAHLRTLAQHVKEGIWAGGGMPLEFGIPSTCANLSNGAEEIKYDIILRDWVAGSVELISTIQQFDALVILASCDNVIAGAYLAAMRLNIPTIIVPGGSMATGYCNGKKVVAADMDVAVLSGNAEEAAKLEELVCPSVGACPSMGTANTMQLLGEVLNLVLPGAASIPATDAQLTKKAHEAGEYIVELAKKDIKPSDLITKETLLNTIMVDMALAGSTNAVLHILAYAIEMGIDITMDDFNKFSEDIKCICGVVPSGPYTVTDLYQAGGAHMVMKALESKLCLNAPALAGGTVGDVLSKIDGSVLKDRGVVRELSDPILDKPGLKVLKGNLSTGGAIVRPTGVPDSMMTFRGTAKVFDHEVLAYEALEAGKILPGDVIVVRYEGCKGAPGMKEVMLITDALVAKGYTDKVALITDARFSGFNHGAIIGHISPEAYEGGAIALVEDGDIINIDIYKGILELEVSDEELAKRRNTWVCPPPKSVKGAPFIYAANCRPAHEGGAMQP